MSTQKYFEKHATPEKLARADYDAIRAVDEFVEKIDKIAATLPEDDYWAGAWRCIVNAWREKDAASADWFAVCVYHIYNSARDAGFDHETAKEVADYFRKRDVLGESVEPPKGVSEEKLKEIYESAALSAAGYAAEFLWELQHTAEVVEEAAQKYRK